MGAYLVNMVLQAWFMCRGACTEIVARGQALQQSFVQECMHSAAELPGDMQTRPSS